MDENKIMYKKAKDSNRLGIPYLLLQPFLFIVMVDVLYCGLLYLEHSPVLWYSVLILAASVSISLIRIMLALHRGLPVIFSGNE
jgi:phosphatidylglycerophosphate synthase